MDTSAHEAVRGGFVSSVIYAWQCGMEGGSALARLAFGDTDFSSALAVTSYFENYTNFVAIDNIALENRGYRFIADESFVYRPFGFAGSYSSWASPVISLLQPSSGLLSVNRSNAKSEINVSVTIDMQRQRSPSGRSDHLSVSRPLLCFLSRKREKHAEQGNASRTPRYGPWPQRWLVAYTKVHQIDALSAGVGDSSHAVATLSFGAEAFERWNADTQRLEVVEGDYEISSVDTAGSPVGAISLTLTLEDREMHG